MFFTIEQTLNNLIQSLLTSLYRFYVIRLKKIKIFESGFHNNFLKTVSLKFTKMFFPTIHI